MALTRGAVHVGVLAGAFEQLGGQALLFHALIGQAGADDARLLGIEQHYFGRPRPCVYAGANHARGALHTSRRGPARVSK